jgi:small subunit ribosomal protein S19
MARSVWKPPFVDKYVLRKAEKAINRENISGNRAIRIMSRRSTILPTFVGLTFEVHNGKKYIPVVVVEEIVGHKFGEFAPTRTFHGHSGDKKINKK